MKPQDFLCWGSGGLFWLSLAFNHPVDKWIVVAAFACLVAAVIHWGIRRSPR